MKKKQYKQLSAEERETIMRTRLHSVWAESTAGIDSVLAQTPVRLRRESSLVLGAGIAKCVQSANRTTVAREKAWRWPASLAAIGLVAFAVGLLVYLTDRDASKATLIPAVALLAGSNLFGALGGWLPSFVHTFAFSLFTAAALPQHSAPRYGTCVAWFAVNVAFETGQHPLISVRLAEVLQGAFGGMPLTRPLANYFAHGTFDPGDIVAALLGALAAAAVLRLMHCGRKANHAQ